MMTLNEIIFYILSFFITDIQRDLHIQKNIEEHILEEGERILVEEEDMYKIFYKTI